MAVCSLASQRQASCIASSSGRCRHNAPLPRRWTKARFVTRANNVDTGSDAPAPGLDLDNPDSEASRKKAEAERLRAAEKFMVIGSGEAACKGCGYEYKPERGDPDFPVAKGTLFQATPEDYYCPVCGASKDQFEARVKVVAGFAENQQYGLGTNSMTSSQKQLIIYGALLLFFALFLGGYALE